MTRQIILGFELTDEQAAILESPSGVALVIPMFKGDLKPLDMKLNKLVEAFFFFKRALATLHQALESGGDQDGRIAKTLAKMGPPVSDALVILEDLRVTMDAAQVVETGDGKAKIQ